MHKTINGLCKHATSGTGLSGLRNCLAVSLSGSHIKNNRKGCAKAGRCARTLPPAERLPEKDSGCGRMGLLPELPAGRPPPADSPLAAHPVLRPTQ